MPRRIALPRRRMAGRRENRAGCRWQRHKGGSCHCGRGAAAASLDGKRAQLFLLIEGEQGFREQVSIAGRDDDAIAPGVSSSEEPQCEVAMQATSLAIASKSAMPKPSSTEGSTKTSHR